MILLTPLLLVLLLLGNSAAAQNQPHNTLQEEARNAKHDTTRVRCLFSIGEHYKFINPDSAIFYYNKALEITGNGDSNTPLYSWYIWNIYKGLGVAHTIKNNYDKALEYHNKQIGVAKLSNDIDGEIKGYNNIGVIYQNLGNFAEAFTFYIKAIKLAEKQNNYYLIGILYNNIAVIYSNLNEFNKSVEYCRKSLEYLKLAKDTISTSHTYLNLGVTFIELNIYPDSSLLYFTLAEKQFIYHNDYNALSLVEQNKAVIYSRKGLYEQAFECISKADKFAVQIGNSKQVANIYQAKALMYVNYYLKKDKDKGYINKAIALNNKALQIASELNLRLEKSKSLILRVRIDSIRSNYKDAFFNLYESTLLTDSIRGFTKNTSIAQIDARFMLEKKQQEIDLLEIQNALKEERSHRMRTVMTISIVGVIILTILIIANIRKLKLTQHQKNVIQKQKEIVEGQINKLNIQNEKITHQKEEIEKNRESMIDSITYARRIQQAVLPKFPESINVEHFVLFQPKDIVSGDFYWFNKTGNNLIFAVADCTGHGVPGGFMSMLGVSFLNEIMMNNHQPKASQILNLLRNLVISSLQQKGTRSEAKDGMDIAICILNTQTNQLQFAGAYGQLYIISANSNEVQTIKGDKQTIAFNNKMEPFNNHQIQLQKGDGIYLASDGYKDQFDADGNKFGVKRFCNLLNQISILSMLQQKNEFEQVIRTWILNSVQIDDITVLGIRV